MERRFLRLLLHTVEAWENPAIFFDMGYFADNWKSTAKLIIGDGVQFRNTESVGDGAGRIAAPP